MKDGVRDSKYILKIKKFTLRLVNKYHHQHLKPSFYKD